MPMDKSRVYAFAGDTVCDEVAVAAAPTTRILGFKMLGGPQLAQHRARLASPGCIPKPLTLAHPAMRCKHFFTGMQQAALCRREERPCPGHPPQSQRQTPTHTRPVRDTAPTILRLPSPGAGPLAAPPPCSGDSTTMPLSTSTCRVKPGLGRLSVGRGLYKTRKFAGVAVIPIPNIRDVAHFFGLPAMRKKKTSRQSLMPDACFSSRVLRGG